MAMLRKSGLMQLKKYKEFINKQGGDISKKLNDPTVTNVLDHDVDISDKKPWSDKALHKLSKDSIINKSNESFETPEELNEDSADFYLGVDYEEAVDWCYGKATPTDDRSLYPLDWEVVEYAIGDEAKYLNDEQIEDFVKSNVNWFDGSIESITGGLNLLGDFENAKGYGNFVLGMEVYGDYAEFTDDYLFARKASDAKVVFVYDTKTEEFYSPKNFKLKDTAKRYNL